jgi:hypothetical protein
MLELAVKNKNYLAIVNVVLLSGKMLEYNHLEVVTISQVRIRLTFGI